MTARNHNVQTPGEAPQKNDAAESTEKPAAETAADAQAEQADTAALAAENESLKKQLNAERKKNARDRSPETDHLPDQKEFTNKQRQRSILTKDGWLAADQPQPKVRA